MADLSTIVGIALMIIGGIFVASGMILCYTTKVRFDPQRSTADQGLSKALDNVVFTTEKRNLLMLNLQRTLKRS